MGFRRKRWHLKVNPVMNFLDYSGLDRQMNTENYANFSFAPKVRTFAVTEKLDQALYRLQQNED